MSSNSALKIPSDKHQFHHESLQDSKSIGQLLEAISKGFARGELNFSDDVDDIQLQAEGLLHLKISASQEDGRNRISLRVTWHDDLEHQTTHSKLLVNEKVKSKKKNRSTS
ncbi:MAG: amphi-Trp domain-containing protein [Zetaproteobacteria bacterium]|nr:amphi-Trp domain-containing protein [Zetaproteobacteria bacterium]